MARLSPAARGPRCSLLALGAAGLWALSAPLWAGHRGGARSPREGEAADGTWAQLLEPLAPGTRLLGTVPLAVCGEADVEGSSGKGRPQVGRGAKAARSGDPHPAGAGSVGGPGLAQRLVSGLSVPPTHLVHRVGTWASLARLEAGGRGSSPMSAPWPLASAMVALGAWGAEHFASASRVPFQPPGLLSLACSRSLPHTEREAVWADPTDRWGSAVSRLLLGVG